LYRGRLTANELDNIVHVECKHTLLQLFRTRQVCQERTSGVYAYFAMDESRQRSWLLSEIPSLTISF